MTAYSGVNYAKTQASPFSAIEEGQYNAPTFRLLDQFVLTADLAVSDTILMGGLIPQGATILGAKLTTGALGGSCTLSWGWNASATALTGAGTAQVADTTAFFNTVAVSSASYLEAWGHAQGGDFYTQTALTAPVQSVITCVAVSSAATGKKIYTDISYTMDV